MKDSYILAARDIATLISTPLDESSLSQSCKARTVVGGMSFGSLVFGGIIAELSGVYITSKFSALSIFIFQVV